MKKSLLALAALSAIAGAAQAQSSVTVYGILDVGYINAHTNGSGTDANLKANTSTFGNSAEQTSRLGFKGTEDLGNGTQALFTIETQLQPTSGTFTSLQTRQAFAGVHKNGVGQAAVGTQYTPAFNALAATDVGQTNNMPGEAVYPQQLGSSNGDSNPAAYGGAANGNMYGGTSGIVVRTGNTLTAQSDAFAGFKLGGAYTLNNNSTSNTTGATSNTITNFSGWGLNADYTWNKLFVTVAQQNYKSQNSTTAAGTGVVTYAAAAPTAQTGGSNVQDNQTYAGATYDFGILKAYAQWTTRKLQLVQDTSYFVKRSAQQIGVRSYITPTIEGWAVIGNGRAAAYGQNIPTANFTAWQLGANYYLSKRTNLYAIYGTNQTSSTSYVTGVSNSAMATGIRHTF